MADLALVYLDAEWLTKAASPVNSKSPPSQV